MSCPTCDCKDWTTVDAPGAQNQSMFSRIAGALFAPFRRGADAPKRMCLRCGTVYAPHASHRGVDEDDEDVIAARMAKIESKMSQISEFGITTPPEDFDPHGVAGLEVRPIQEMKCPRCGHFAFVQPAPGAACPNCGRLYEKMDASLREAKKD